MLTKCICTNCAGHLEFEEENAGEKIKCPHCSFETTLFLPGQEPKEDFAPPSPRFLRSKGPMFIGVAVVTVALVGYSLYRWVLPSVKEWLPNTESAVLPIFVLAAGCLFVLMLAVWTVIPILAYLQMRRVGDALKEISSGLRPVLPVDPFLEEETPVEESHESEAHYVAVDSETSEDTEAKV